MENEKNQAEKENGYGKRKKIRDNLWENKNNASFYANGVRIIFVN